MDAYRDVAAFYDCEHDPFTDDVHFYRNVIEMGPVLEVGTGTGRIAAALAQAGHEVWGIDPSAAMLRQASERTAHLPNVHLVCGMVGSVEMSQRFAAVIVPLNTLWHLPTTQDQLETLSAIHGHLVPGGLLVVDLTNPLTMADRGARGELRQVFRGPCRGGTLTRLAATWDDEGEQTLDVSLTYQLTGGEAPGESALADFTFRYLYRSEAELLVTLAGFQVTQVYGSYDLEPYSGESARILLVAVAR